MQLEDQFKYIVGAYYGVREMDEYPLKVYVLKDIENYLKDFLDNNPIPNFDYRHKALEIEEKMSLKTKLQDALLVLYKIDASLELIALVKKRIKRIDTNRS